VDHAFTRFCGGGSPPFLFKSADDHYVWASNHRHISSIRVPFLAINAADDLIVGFTPAEETAHGQTCALAVTASGGHLGVSMVEVLSDVDLLIVGFLNVFEEP